MSKPTTAFVLIHSPLVGPFTWALTAGELRRQGFDAVVPALDSPEEPSQPYWRLHVEAVARALEATPVDTPLVLAGHSGGGMILPAIRQVTGRSVAAYIFVDAGVPQDGKSRFDLFESRAAAEGVRASAVDGHLPAWSDDDLREVIPDDHLRHRFVSELRPLPLAVYEEPIPVFEGWPDAPVSYVRFGDNPAYDGDVEHARRAGWPVMRMEGEHFHMLVEPAAVANALIKAALGPDG